MSGNTEETSSRVNATEDQRDPVAPAETASALVRVLDDYMAELQAGKAPDRSRLLADHPDLAAQLERCLAGIDFIHRAIPDAGDAPAKLGDFRLLREVGRGGMGVVYEAEQVSLRRTVALKVLRYGTLADETALLRFHREAETVAQLHHTNIVPLHTVGSEGGVHYFAMQFIQGRSLADLLAEARSQGKDLAPRDVADWGRQAAEALAYAHQREVIHRDIKPSNLMLDGNGILWLTDFGLAKRNDEATLTVIGTLMGTPRYMSPEQAESLTRPVDHRTDIYSLGASLYELATGKPIFEAQTSHGVITKILHEEPVAPRQARPGLPRDLETIILTCLAKDAARRYPTAKAVAADLGAWLDDRPIRARRVRLPERAVRYVQKRRKIIAAATLTFAASTLVLVAGVFGLRWRDESIKGRLTLKTDASTALTALVLDNDRDQPVADEFTVPNLSPVALLEGAYRVRVQAGEWSSQTYRLFVDPGRSQTFEVGLDDHMRWGPERRPAAPAAEAVDFSDHADLVEWDGVSLRRRDGKTGSVVWAAAAGRTGWPAGDDFRRWMGWLGSPEQGTRSAHIIRPAPDLNGDGTPDLVFALQTVPVMLAVSGKDGGLLWANPKPGTGTLAPVPGQIAGPPISTDADGDGAPDLIAVFSADAADPPSRRYRIAAVSGRSGLCLWEHELEAGAPRCDIALIRRDGRPVVAVAHGGHWLGLDPATGQTRTKPLDLPAPTIRAPQYADGDGDGGPEIVAVCAGDDPTKESLWLTSLATGQPVWTATILAQEQIEPSDEEPRAPYPLVADIDGDGRPEFIALAAIPVEEELVDLREKETLGLLVIDGATGKERWHRDLNAAVGKVKAERLVKGPDLDGDGKAELFLASLALKATSYVGNRHGNLSTYDVFVEAISGGGGRQLWWWRGGFTCAGEQGFLGQLQWWGPGPDGWPQLLVEYGRYGGPHTLQAIALGSGEAAQSVIEISRPRTADLNGDGLADLWGTVKNHVEAIWGAPPVAWRLLGRCKPAGDFDRDGTDDVLCVDPKSPMLRALSGRNGRLLWLAKLESLGDVPWSPVSTVNSVLQLFATRTFSLPHGDLDGDGTPDVLVSRDLSSWSLGLAQTGLPVAALSGKTGKRLWSAGAPPSTEKAQSFHIVWGLDARDLGDGKGPAVTALVYTSPAMTAMTPSYWWKLQLVRLSAHDGSVTWALPLSVPVPFPFTYNPARPYYGLHGTERLPDDPVLVPVTGGPGSPWWALDILGSDQTFPHEVCDLDGDGAPEMVVAVPVQGGVDTIVYELCAVSLRDGRVLWRRGLRQQFGERGKGRYAPSFATGDLDGDRKAEVVVIEKPDQASGIEVMVLDGKDGTTRWRWAGGTDQDRARTEATPLRLVASDSSGGRRVCLGVGTNELVVLGDQGRVLERRTIEATASGLTFRSEDLDGDGREELLVEGKDKVMAIRVGVPGVLWEKPVTGGVSVPCGEDRGSGAFGDCLHGRRFRARRPRWSDALGRRAGSGAAGDGRSSRPATFPLRAR